MTRKIIFSLLLVASSQCYAQGLPRSEWLANLRPIMGPHLCAPVSPLLRAYKEDLKTCPGTIEFLFDKCTKDNTYIEIPSFIESENQANYYGQVIAECITANYFGGTALDTFLMLQGKKK